MPAFGPIAAAAIAAGPSVTGGLDSTGIYVGGIDCNECCGEILYCECWCDSVTQVPCTLCVQVTSFDFTGLDECDNIDEPVPPPWFAELEATNATPSSAYNTSVIATGTTSVLRFITRIECDEFDGSLSYWRLYISYLPADCPDIVDPLDVLVDEIEITDCDYSVIYGNHVVNVTDGATYSIDIAYSVNPGMSCGIGTECCARPASQVLVCHLFYPAAQEVVAQLEWNAGAGKWLCVSPAEWTASYLECVADEWHLYMEHSTLGVKFDDPLFVFMPWDCRPMYLVDDLGAPGDIAYVIPPSYTFLP